MSEFQLYRDESRKNYGSSNDPLSLPQLQAGCLMRIADATEKMAQRHTELRKRLAAMKGGAQ